MYAIKTEKLTKKYKEKTAVSNLDLKINEGEMYGLLGVNGAGKTTTMKMLTTLIMPTSGEAELLGHSIKTDRAAVKQIIGISPQESAAAMNLTARENLGRGLRPFKESCKSQSKRTYRTLLHAGI